MINPFFHTVLPHFDEEDPPLVLRYQQRYVDKLLSITLDYDHILYCIDNETNADPAWPRYWSAYIGKRAAERDLEVEVTESWDSFDPTGGALHGAKVQNPSVHFFTRRANATNTLNDPQSYSFIEIANHNFQEGETHFQTGYCTWQQVQRSGMIRPINNVKIYGASDIGWANDREGQERFWRNVFAGSAAVRFHRRPHGLGNSQLAKAHMKSLRLFVDAVDTTAMRPRPDLLHERAENSAYCLADAGSRYASSLWTAAAYISTQRHEEPQRRLSAG